MERLKRIPRKLVGLCMLGLYMASLLCSWGLVGVSAQPSQTTLSSTTPTYPLLPTFRHLATFEAEVDFVSAVGKTDHSQIFAYWRDQPRGLLLAELYVDGQRGVQLPNGMYQWTFRLRRGSQPAQLPSSPVFTLSIWDVTTGERLAERTLHQSDFPQADVWYERSLLHSTVGRENHRFEPRVLWEDFVDGYVDHVRLAQSISHLVEDLEEKALALDRQLQAEFLDLIPGTNLTGHVVARTLTGQAAERGDSATMTGLYVTAEAFRLLARPGDTEARQNMAKGFQALHTLLTLAKDPGILPRYADTDGQWSYADACEAKWHAGRVQVDTHGTPACSLQQTTCQADGTRQRAVCPNGTRYYEEWSKEVISEDAYAAFAFAVAVGYPLIMDPALKAAIADDVKTIVRHLLAHDFKIVKAGSNGVATKYVHFNPYVPEEDLHTLIAEKLEERNILGQLAEVYTNFWNFRLGYNILGNLSEFLQLISFNCIHGFPFMPENLLPAVNADLVNAIEHKDVETIVALLPEFVRNVRTSLVTLHAFLGQTSGYLRSAIECAGRLPNSSVGENFRDLLRFIDSQFLPQLSEIINRIPTQITTLKDLKFDASSAAAAAQLLAVARMIDPTEFEEPYYHFLLGGGKDLLQTMETWANVGETLAVLLKGDLGADKQRSKTHWRGFAALYTLIRLETRADLAERFRTVFERGWLPSADEGNAFYDALRAMAGTVRPGQLPVDVGVMGWAFASMPREREGFSAAQWQQLLPDIAVVSGDQQESGFMRDPIPVAIRSHNEMLLWQRNPRLIDSPDHMQGLRSPSLDYVLPYYVAQAAGLRPTPPSTTTAIVPLVPVQTLKTLGEQGLTIGRGSGLHRECKTQGGMVRTPGELGRLLGPYGEVTVGPNGARLADGYAHVRVLTMEGDARLTVNVQPEGVSYWAEVCRAGGIEKPGAEVKLDIDIVSPTTAKQTTLGSLCPFDLLASSGEQGKTLGSGLKSKSEELHVSVALPAGAAPLGGPMGTFAFGGNGYDDEFARVRIITWQRVEEARITKSSTGASVGSSPHHFLGSL